MNANKKTTVTRTFVLALVLTLAAAGAFGDSSITRARDVGPQEAQVRTVSIPRDQIVARVVAMTSVAKRVARIDAKVTTWTAYRQSHDTGITFVRDSMPADTPVWVVAVAGDFVPPHTRGEVYPWGVIVFNAANGDWLFTEASYDGLWPAFYDAMP